MSFEDIATNHLDKQMDFEKYSEQVSELLDVPDENKTERITQ